MLNLKYFLNIVVYFTSSVFLEYIYLQGLFYLVQDYFLFLASLLDSFVCLSLSLKVEFSWFFLSLIFLSLIF